MPALVKELDQGLAYVFCPTCRLGGNQKSPLARDGHVIKCHLGHSFTGSQLLAMGADMVALDTVQPEQPTITDIKWPIWINPKVKEKLEQKYPNRLIITVATTLAALSDDTMVMITGEQGKKLRDEHHVRTGAEIISALDAAKQMAQERDEALLELDKFHKLLQAAGVLGAAQSQV